MTGFPELLDRVQRLTGLELDDAIKVAKAVWGDGRDDTPTPAEIVSHAETLGFDIAPDDSPPAGANEPSVEDAMADMTDEEKMHLRMRTALEPLGLSLDPAEVLSEVYMTMPRVLHRETPKLGRAPDEAYKYFSEELNELPEEVIAALVKIDLYEGKATFWLRDEANDVDRPVGPIDVTRYEGMQGLSAALNELFKRLPHVFAADMN